MARTKIFVERMEGAWVVNFSHSSLFNPQQVEEIVSDLLQMVVEEDCRAMLLDFARVRSFSSSFLGRLLDVKRVLDERNGRLVVTGLSEQLRELVRKVQLDTVLMVRDDREEALAVLRGEAGGDEEQGQA